MKKRYSKLYYTFCDSLVSSEFASYVFGVISVFFCWNLYGALDSPNYAMNFPSYEYYLIEQVYEHSLWEFVGWFCAYIIALLVWFVWSLLILPGLITAGYLALCWASFCIFGVQLGALALICIIPVVLSILIVAGLIYLADLLFPSFSSLLNSDRIKLNLALLVFSLFVTFLILLYIFSSNPWNGGGLWNGDYHLFIGFDLLYSIWSSILDGRSIVS